MCPKLVSLGSHLEVWFQDNVCHSLLSTKRKCMPSSLCHLLTSGMQAMNPGWSSQAFGSWRSLSRLAVWSNSTWTMPKTHTTASFTSSASNRVSSGSSTSTSSHLCRRSTFNLTLQGSRSLKTLMWGETLMKRTDKWFSTSFDMSRCLWHELTLIFTWTTWELSKRLWGKRSTCNSFRTKSS